MEIKWILIEDFQRILGVVDDPQKAMTYVKIEQQRWREHRNGNYTWLSEDGLHLLMILRFKVNEFYPDDPAQLVNAVHV